MAKKKENKEQIIEQIELKETVKEKEKVLLENIKKELTSYIDDKFKGGYTEEMDKVNKRLIREKNKKIVFRNIVIIILIGVIGLLVLLMYKDNYFDRFFHHEKEDSGEVIKENDKDNSKEETDKPKEEDKKEEVKKPTFEELEAKYGNLIDYYVLSPNSVYKQDFYNGKLTSEIKKYMTLNTIDFTTVKEEDDYNTLNESTFRKIFDTMFKDGYEAGNFDYNGNKIRYLKGYDTYMSTVLLKKDTDTIAREIVDIKEDNNVILITTVEGLVKESKLYNVVTNAEILEYEGDNLSTYQDRLNTITYKFSDGKLIDVSK